MKKTCVAVHIMVLCACTAFAADLQGIVTEVTGDSITIEVSEDVAASFNVGEEVKLDIHVEPTSGDVPTLDMLYG